MMRTFLDLSCSPTNPPAIVLAAGLMVDLVELLAPLHFQISYAAEKAW